MDSANPFTAILQPDDQSAPDETPATHEQNPFADILDTSKPLPQETSLLGATAFSAAKSLIPAAGTVAGAAAGGKAGFTLGLFGGPLAEVTAPALGFAGAIAGGIYAGRKTEEAQDLAFSKLPASWRDPLEEYGRAAAAEHPTGTFFGGLAPYALTGGPAKFWGKAAEVGENAGLFQRLMAYPTTRSLVSGGILGGLELTQELEQGQSPDWTNIAISTGFGMIFNRPTHLGETIEGFGSRAITPLTDRIAALPRAQEGYARIAAADVLRQGEGAPRAMPTLAEAADVKVMGRGITKGVFDGTKEQSPETKADAQNMRRQELPPAEVDLHAKARQMEPEAFDRADALDEERESLRARISEAMNPTDRMRDEAKTRMNDLIQDYNDHVDAHNGYTGGPDARRMRAQIREATREFEDINARREAWAAGTAQESEKTAAMRARLAAATMERMDAGREIAAALRRAEEHANGPAPEPVATTAPQEAAPAETVATTAPQTEPTHPPEETRPPAPQPSVTPPEMRQRIADDVAARLANVGIDPDKAKAWGHVVAARMATRAAWRTGETAEELYHKEALNFRNIAFAEFQRERAEGARRAKAVLKPADDGSIVVNGQRITGEAAAQLRAKVDEAEKTAPRGTDEERAPLIVNGQEVTGESAALLRKAMARAAEPKPEPAIHAATVDDVRYRLEEMRGEELFQGAKASTFYSAVGRAIESAKQEKASPQQWLATIKNTAGVKPEEMKWLGLEDWLKEQKGAVTRAQITDYVRANSIEVKEVEKGGEPVTDNHAEFLRNNNVPIPGVKYSQYTLPGGENYREMLLTLPQKEPISFDDFLKNKGVDVDSFDELHQNERNELQVEYRKGAAHPNDYKSAHWEEPNIISHIRFDDRVGPNGEKVLHIAEVQSDWHQEGRKKGYTEPLSQAEKVEFSDLEAKQRAGTMNGDDAARLGELSNRDKGYGHVPDAPFKTSWPELAMKRMLRYAVDHGYDRLSWDTGETSADRYDLSKKIRELYHWKDSDGLIGLSAYDHDDRAVLDQHYVKPEELEGVVGKEMAQKILDGEGSSDHDQAPEVKVFRGLDLKVGGEGMRGFYDDILPKAVNKLVKKFGAKVENSTLAAEHVGENGNATGWESTGQREGTIREETPVHSVAITDELAHAAAYEGFPLFQDAKAAINLPSRMVSLFEKADFSSIVHEGSHDFLDQMQRDARHEEAPEQLKTDFQTVLKWFNGDARGNRRPSTAENIQERHHEKFARAFERYLTEGRAPTQGLAGVFEKIKRWMLDIYQGLRGIKAPINDEIRAVFDRMLTEEPQRHVVAEAPEPSMSLADVHHADAATIEPQEAGPAADRLFGEIDRQIEELPDDTRAATGARPGATIPAAEPTGAGAGGGTGGGEAGEAGAKPAAKPSKGGAAIGEKLPSGGKTPPETSGVGAGKPAGDKSPIEQLAPRPPESPIGQPSRLQSVDNLVREVAGDNAEAAKALRDLMKDTDDFVGDRRGQITHGQTVEMAAAMGVAPEDLSRQIGQAHNAEQIYTYSLAIQRMNDRVWQAGQAGDAAKYESEKALRAAIIKQFAGARAEAGRALGIFNRILKDVGASAGQDKTFFQTWKEITGKEFHQSHLEAQMAGREQSPQGVAQFLHDSEKRTFGRMAFEYWVNGLVSGPITHITYGVSNVISLVQKLGPETAVAAGLHALRGGEEPGVRFGEVPAGARGLAQGFLPATEAAFRSLRSGATVQLPGEKPLRGGYFRGEGAPLNEAAGVHDVKSAAFGVITGLKDAFRAAGAIVEPGKTGSPAVALEYSSRGMIPNFRIRAGELPIGDFARSPGNFIAAFHSFTRALAYSVEKNALAYRNAAGEGLKGADLDKRVAELVTKPTQEMMEAGHREASVASLMGSGGTFTRKLSSLVNQIDVAGFPLGKFVMPFVHISTNVLDEAILKRTALGWMAPEIRADLLGKNGPVAMDKARARMLWGTATALTAGAIAAEGYLTGSGPDDAKERSVWQAAGKQAYSVRIGDTWYSYKRLGPLGMQLGIAADLFDIMHRLPEEEASDAAGRLIHAIAQNVLDESFVRGPADLLRAIHDPERYGGYYVRNELASFVPFSVGMSQMARAVDPYTRDARTMVDAIKAKIPFVSEGLRPKLDIWGNPTPSRAGLGFDATAIWEQKQSSDPVNQEMLRLGCWPTAVERKIRGVHLTDEQHDEFATVAGHLAKQNLDRIIGSQQWLDMPDHVRRDVIDHVFRTSRESARGWMMARHREIPIEAVQRKREGLR